MKKFQQFPCHYNIAPEKFPRSKGNPLRTIGHARAYRPEMNSGCSTSEHPRLSFADKKRRAAKSGLAYVKPSHISPGYSHRRSELGIIVAFIYFEVAKCIWIASAVFPEEK